MSKGPGRLGNPESTFETDERADPRIAAVMAMAALASELVPAAEPPGSDGSYEDALIFCAQFEATAALAHEMAFELMPAFASIESSEFTIKGIDGNDILLFVDQPKDRDGDLPCIVHTHGGGMVMMSARDPGFVRLRKTLAASGLVVIGVEFRNGGGELGHHPFPAGLNDCASATRWVHENREKLGISNIVISGESGGGNLAIATTLKAKREGWSDEISGVFAMCPYIAGTYVNPPESLLSLRENDGYMMDGPIMSSLVKVYDPTGEQAGNPLAWPLQAAAEDLVGLPPHIISVNELDPLRDEGLAFYRKLTAAGVSAVARTVHGTPHAGDVSFPDVTPDIYGATVRAITGFAISLRQ